MGAHIKAISVRMDNRFHKESVIISDLASIPAGRRNDFARECMIAGYETLKGRINAPSLLDGVSADNKTTEEVQEKRSEKPSENKNAGVSLIGLTGDQT